MKLVSFPHTGTRFVREVLYRGWHLIDEQEKDSRAAYSDSPPRYTSHHTDIVAKGLVTKPGEQVIVPMRDPFLAQITKRVTGWGLPAKQWDTLYFWLHAGEPETYEVVHVPLCWHCEQMLSIYLGDPVGELPREPVGASPDSKFKTHYLTKGTCPSDPQLAREWAALGSLKPATIGWITECLGPLPWMP